MNIVLISELVGNAQKRESRLGWASVDDESLKLDDYSLKPLPPPAHHALDTGELLYSDYALVLTGDVFRWMLNYAPLETLHRVSSSIWKQQPHC